MIIKDYKVVNTKRQLEFQRKSASNFIKIEKLFFTKNYEFNFDTINLNVEKLAGAEFNLNLNLFELINLKRKKSKKIFSMIQREPVHEIEVKIIIFEHKFTKILSKNKTFSTLKYLMNKTIKIDNHVSQRDFFRQINQSSEKAVFDLSTAVKQWINKMNSSKQFQYNGIQIEFQIELKTNSHVYSLKNDAENLEKLLKKNPIMNIYLNDGNAKKVQEREQPRVNVQKNIRDNNCKRKSWKINFKDIEWDKFIIRPKVLNAYYCNGLCEGPFDNSLNATNHAIMQYLAFNSGNYNFLPKICCVPTKYTSEYFLFRDFKNNIVIKLIDDIVVQSCGCR
jgi:hypothetical protein